MKSSFCSSLVGYSSCGSAALEVRVHRGARVGGLTGECGCTNKVKGVAPIRENSPNLGREGTAKQAAKSHQKFTMRSTGLLSLQGQGNPVKGLSVSGCYGDLGSEPSASQLLGSPGDFTQQVLCVSFCIYCDNVNTAKPPRPLCPPSFRKFQVWHRQGIHKTLRLS